MADETRDIPVSLLHEPWIIMRPVVKDSVEYLERRDSIARFGFHNSLCVRPSPRQPGKYELIDGMWRFSVALELCLETVPCIIKTGLTDEDVLAIQIQANAVRADTTPVEYARQLRRILDRTGGTMTLTDLARMSGKSATWVKDQLGLLELPKDVQLMVDRGEIRAQSAYMLAKIPSRWRRDYIEQALAMRSKEFCLLAASVIKRFAESVQQGKMDERYVTEFTPQPYLRGVKEVKSELDDPKVGATMLVSLGCKTMLDAWNACLRWALHLDPQSIDEQRKKAELRSKSHIRRETESLNEAVDD